MVLETIWFREAVQGFFLLFLIILYFFFPFGDFCYFRGILEEKRGFFGLLEAFQAFWRLFRWFYGLLEVFQAFWRLFSGIFGAFKGNMVGKQTNEPCSGVDEVVNTFWVLTPFTMLVLATAISGLYKILHRLCHCEYEGLVSFYAGGGDTVPQWLYNLRFQVT